MAKAAHITESMVARFERDGKVPTYNNLQAICSVLEAWGIVLVPANRGGAGVRFSVPPERQGPTTEPSVFRSLCRAARNIVGLSQEETAEAAGLGRSTVADFERGARVPSPANLKALRETLEGAGVVFIEADGSAGPGVRLRR
ncbi:helix-turn-helix domain-containing protein [Pelagibius sp.]|uniref:helix-turn-helix domain-containing protein n=1 Tax=Pelagibius sp. TaxID=1931238 RepID=UPI003BADAE00